jgi:phage-related protein
MSPWSVEVEPEVERWMASLGSQEFSSAASRIDYLAESGSSARMPRSRSLGAGLFELRFNLGTTAIRVTYYFAGGRRIVLLTVFQKQRQNERAEVDRARRVMARCVAQRHTADEEGL